MQVMRWAQLLSPIRLGSKKNRTSDKSGEQGRTAFHKDYDRIIFSSSFRQLNRKTQVHPLTQNDGIHTRLTHSLEVSCIGRSLGMLAAEKIRDELPAWIDVADVGAIIQAACLAHDIGNPPFGHAGEYAIRDWFEDPKHQHLLISLTAEQRADVCQFEGNAQGLRVLSRLEYHPDDGGMRLTYATLGAYLKYPWLAKPLDPASLHPSHKRAKFGCYQSEKGILQEIAEHLGLIQTGDYQFCRHPLTYLLEAADDICYALIDLEDGLQLGMLHYHEVEPLFLTLIADYGAPDEISRNVPIPQKLAALRGRAMKRLVDEVTDAFKRQHDQILAGQLKGSLLDHCPPDLCHGVEAAKNLARERIFTHPQKARLELVANSSLHILLDAFMPLAVKQHHLSFREQRLMHILHAHGAVLNEDPSFHYHNIMQILDMLSSLSDHQAYGLSQELQGNRVTLL
ncbi:deoxyguanosinetriphosphate triphosphohydrolase [Alkanindiges hydrocarboniclasticus]|jgi:dGTPase|uniref:Deoxyguanosinetriphosphate triphosphohydrolase n=1 Tax=Alkanindiges hydrocarboniclasticus TaxID=1907941 RepID=A0A1S8CXT6_9GAMM|nr:deoxyguanosinetriphosphate triphosphohydrolase [Alkanindiges hydrocarboniclasticus]ONG41652.1 deoxyguanosinetriphosphate triphosphohydrolase [Alkanindiges hydrocarboniclasticus]